MMWIKSINGDRKQYRRQTYVHECPDSPSVPNTAEGSEEKEGGD
jgi:hypothetical protein